MSELREFDIDEDGKMIEATWGRWTPNAEARARIKELEAEHVSLMRSINVALMERDRIKRAGKALAEQVDDYFTGRPDGEDLLFAAAVLRETTQPNQEVDDE